MRPWNTLMSQSARWSFLLRASRLYAIWSRSTKHKEEPTESRVQEVMRSSYRNHYRQILPALLDVLDFRSNNTAYQPVIQALAVVREYVDSRLAWYPLESSPPLEGVIPSAWENVVTEKDSAGEERVNRLTYELGVLQTLRERVRTKEIWVAGAAHFRNPEDDLPRDFEQHRATYYADLNQPLSADEFVASLQTQLTTALASFERFMAKKPGDVVIGTKRGKGWITLSPLPAQPEPKHLPRVKTEIIRRWGMTDLLDMFKESALLTGCLDCFQSTGSREALDPELLQKRLLLCIYGMGTNIGLKRLAGVDPNIDAEQLRYTRRRYLHKDHMRAAIAEARQCAVARATGSHLGRDDLNLCLRLQEVPRRRAEFADPVACPLSRPWRSRPTSMWNVARCAFIRS